MAEPTTGAAESRSPLVAYALGLVGAVAGGAIGYFAFAWILTQGFYAMMLPGALLGLGCGLLSRRRSLPLGIICAVIAIPLGYFCEWRERPWIKDDGLEYFVANLGELSPMTHILVMLGGAFAFWFGKGR